MNSFEFCSIYLLVLYITAKVLEMLLEILVKPSINILLSSSSIVKSFSNT